MNEVEAAQQAVIEEFGIFDGWMDRYQYLIDLGRRLPGLADDEKVDGNMIRGCQSQVWFVIDESGERLKFRAISDAAIVSGLIALLTRIYSDKPAADIVATEPGFVRALGLDAHLSPTRSTGLASMLAAIRGHAEAAAQRA